MQNHEMEVLKIIEIRQKQGKSREYEFKDSLKEYKKISGLCS